MDLRRRLLGSWFLIVLVTVLAVGLGQGPRLADTAERFPRLGLVAAIMFATALPIDFAPLLRGSSLRASGAWGAIGLATLLNTVVAPALGGLASLAAPVGLATGLVVATASPCTLASAAVWTRRGGGNDSVAVVVTLITTLGCFAVLPLWAWGLLGESVEADFGSLTLKLLACVVAPILAAQICRRIAEVAAWASRHKRELSVAAQLGVLTMAFLGAINAGATLRSMTAPIGATDWLLVAGLTAAVHVVLLSAGWRIGGMLGMAPPEALAVAIAGSQKTLAVGVGIALEFGGLAIFPMIVYHIGQLLIDTVFVDRVRRRAAT